MLKKQGRTMYVLRDIVSALFNMLEGGYVEVWLMFRINTCL